MTRESVGLQMATPSYAELKRVLLLALASQPDGIRPSDAYPLVEALLPQLTAEDVSRRQPDGRNAWRNTVQHIRYQLANEGLVDRSESGIWRLTPQGFEQARAMTVEYQASDERTLAVADEAQSPYGQAALEPANEAVRMMLITLLNEVSNAELPWTSGRLDDGSMVIYYNGRLRVLLLP